MHQDARRNYLETQVMTAPPERLRLMLIDAAIRCVNKAKQHWNEDDFGTAWESISRARDIVSELLGGLNREVNPELSDKIAAIYIFLFREMNEVATSRDISKLDGILKVLDQERKTWLDVCDLLAKQSASENDGAHLQLENSPAVNYQAPNVPSQIPPPAYNAAPFTTPSDMTTDDLSTSRFSLEG